MAGKLSITWFHPEELDLMKRCLEAMVSGRHIEASHVDMLTNCEFPATQDDVDRFDTLCEFSKKDFRIIERSIFGLALAPIDNQEELEAFLGIKRLYLKWFF